MEISNSRHQLQLAYEKGIKKKTNKVLINSEWKYNTKLPPQPPKKVINYCQLLRALQSEVFKSGLDAFKGPPQAQPEFMCLMQELLDST